MFFGIGGTFLISLALAHHFARTGRSPLWIHAVGSGCCRASAGRPISWLGGAAGHGALRLGPPLRRQCGECRRSRPLLSREACADVERQAPRILCWLWRRNASAALLPTRWNSMKAPCRDPSAQDDPTLIKGLARARMLSGDGVAAESLFP